MKRITLEQITEVARELNARADRINKARGVERDAAGNANDPLEGAMAAESVIAELGLPSADLADWVLQNMQGRLLPMLLRMARDGSARALIGIAGANWTEGFLLGLEVGRRYPLEERQEN